MRTLSNALGSGAVGAAVLTLIHEGARRRIPRAPRMDIVGMRAVDHVMDWMNLALLKHGRLRTAAFAGDLVGNSLYYAAVPGRTPGETWFRGLTLGALAGIGAVALPERIGLGTPPDSNTRTNQLMTVAWYVIGGLAAAAAANAFRDRDTTDFGAQPAG